jgi:hypothetical protein
MIFGYFTLFVALTISAVAEFYSIVGLTAIFSAAFWPIVIMGASLGVGKITAAVWLKLNWERASWTYKLYLVPAVAFLMMLTSMGIFGFLSKAHSDQSMISGDSMAKVAIYDEKIKISKDNIDANRKALKQMDEAVDQVMGRSTDEKGADKAVGVRRSQQKERTRLLAEIQAEQKTITSLSEEVAPLRAEFRKVEAEVGPIKYIAALVYGDNPDANILEKAVRLVIILIVAVFDPLALVLILAAQQSLRWAREERDAPKPILEPENTLVAEQPVEVVEEKPVELEVTEEEEEAFRELEPKPEPEKTLAEQHPYLNQPFAHFEGLTPMVYKPESDESTGTVYINPPDWGTTPIPDMERPGDYVTPPVEDEEHEHEISIEEKAAMVRWKNENPGATLKHQRTLLEEGSIEELPWMKYVTKTSFGVTFPETANKGDTFVKIDRTPNTLHKFNGSAWIEVDKNLSDSYTYDVAYIDHLISKIATNEYDSELLTDSEREQVEQRLLNNPQE